MPIYASVLVIMVGLLLSGMALFCMLAGLAEGVMAWFLLLFMQVGSIAFFLIGVSGLVRSVRYLIRWKLLTRSGKKISVRLTRVEVNKNLTANGHHPYRLVSEWEHPDSKVLYVFLSRQLWVDPDPYIPDDRMLDVYVDARDYKRYVMDTSFVPAEKEREAQTRTQTD